MNALHLADRLKEAENKIGHLRRAIDYISERQELAESIDVLGRVIKDYQVECEKMKKMLSQINVSNHDNRPEREEPTFTQ
ncbi:hypothetical protein LOK74_04875 [Brevibacillus humidisoli]|uniref:hypothetical protein n=1 Tax=Brevibacillus humidisoli TaxID=2895522 RepID=UPI001E35B680|nr:hypothetical protein [Brevibacillus humidisoli]UFJ41840.1 hypothetical protein LOK74_04875 [Brevibacillus humidisoli]